MRLTLTSDWYLVDKRDADRIRRVAKKANKPVKQCRLFGHVLEEC